MFIGGRGDYMYTFSGSANQFDVSVPRSTRHLHVEIVMKSPHPSIKMFAICLALSLSYAPRPKLIKEKRCMRSIKVKPNGAPFPLVQH